MPENQGQLLMHAGGEYVDLETLKSVAMPKETKTYKPVGHYDLAMQIGTIAQDLLPDLQSARSQYGLARNGAQMFGVHVYTPKGGDTLTEGHEMGLTIGFRNSYDKSMSIGIAVAGRRSRVWIGTRSAASGVIRTSMKTTRWNRILP